MHQTFQTILLLLILVYMIHIDNDARHTWKILVANQRIINDNQTRLNTASIEQNKEILEILTDVKAARMQKP